MKYTIGQNVETKTSAKGNSYKRFGVKDEQGKITPEVAAFGSFSKYGEIVSGAEIEAVLREKDYNGGKSYTLEDGNLGTKPWKTGGGSAMIAEKTKSIEKAQERKEEGVAISSTARDATLIVTTFYHNLSDDEIKTKILGWRKWLMDNWDNVSGKPVESQFMKTYGVDYPEETDPDNIPF